jgi:hypothetical protein
VVQQVEKPGLSPNSNTAILASGDGRLIATQNIGLPIEIDNLYLGFDTELGVNFLTKVHQELVSVGHY